MSKLGVSTGQVYAQPTTDPLTLGGRLNNWLLTTLSQVGSISDGQWLGWSALVLSYNHRIFARSKIKTTTSSPNLSKNFISSSDLSKNQSKITTSSLDLSKIFISLLDVSKKTYIFTRSNQILPNLQWNINESKWI